MTCIVGLVDDGCVYMGGDSCASDGYSVALVRSPKVFRAGAFVIGYTTSFRMGQILKYHLHVTPQGDKPDEAFMVGTFVEAARDCLKRLGFAKVENNREEAGEFLVGYRGALYKFFSDLNIHQGADDFCACGAGEPYALGALAALEGQASLLPRKRILCALGAAARYSAFVRKPFHVVQLGEEAG